MLSKSQTLYILVLLAVIAVAAAVTAGTELEVSSATAFLAGLSIISFCIPTFIAVRRWLGTTQSVLVFAGFGVLALAIETFAMLTGFPYGEFRHSNFAGLKLPGGVPWTVAFAWTPLVLAAYAFAAQLARSSSARIVGTAVGLVAFDLV